MTEDRHMLITLRELRLANQLRIDYTCTNQGKQPFYVYTCITQKGQQPLPNRAYTAYRAADETLHLFLGVPPIPRGLRVYAKVVPFASLLRPGEQHADYLEVPIPIAEWQPYADPPETSDVDIVQARRVLVSTEYFGEGRLVRPPQWDREIRQYRALGAQTQRVEAAIELSEPVSVLKRRDDFERF
jgi:hypothetical protein